MEDDFMNIIPFCTKAPVDNTDQTDDRLEVVKRIASGKTILLSNTPWTHALNEAENAVGLPYSKAVVNISDLLSCCTLQISAVEMLARDLGMIGIANRINEAGAFVDRIQHEIKNMV